MVQDVTLGNLFTASFAFLIFFFLQQAHWRATLRKTSKSPADLPGGAWWFNAYLLLQTLLYALTLAAVMTPITGHGYDWSSRDLWRDFAIVLVCAITINLSVGCVARRVWPSLKAIDAALTELSKNTRREKQAAK